MPNAIGAGLLLALCLAVASADAASSRARGFAWDLPPGFPVPQVPADNPMSEAKVRLGRYLFHDTRLSGNGRQSCASCHQQSRAFADGRARAIGSTGVPHPRGSMSLVNVAYSAAPTWAGPRVSRLEDQARIPMFGDHPIELGLTPDGPWLGAIRGDATYAPLIGDAFGVVAGQLTVDHVVGAIASFERTIISARSPYDRYRRQRDDAAIPAAARRGETLFHSRPMSCFRCHGGFLFAGDTTFEGRGGGDVEFHNTGLYNLPGLFSYPAENTGVYDTTRDPRDVGKFKAPTLRNIARTAPYMHDGSIATLEDVVDHYAQGGRTIAAGPYAGRGHENPNRSPIVNGFVVTPDQRADLVAFLNALTDEAVLSDPRFTDPWVRSGRP